MIEESGTACGLDWRDEDRSFFKAMLLINSFLAVIAALSLWATFTHDEATAGVKETEEEWFTDKQLNWVFLNHFTLKIGILLQVYKLDISYVVFFFYTKWVP